MWTLTVKTSLPKACWSDDDLKVTAAVFETFEDAKCGLRKVLKDLAFADNAMFDGNGYLIQMNHYIDDCIDNEKQDPDCNDIQNWISSKTLQVLQEDLRKIFCGEDTKITLNKGWYNDGFIAVKVQNGCVTIKGSIDGPINGIAPRISIDMFDMTTPKNYHLYIDDFFGGLWDQRVSAELYIDLVEAQCHK